MAEEGCKLEGLGQDILQSDRRCSAFSVEKMPLHGLLGINKGIGIDAPSTVASGGETYCPSLPLVGKGREKDVDPPCEADSGQAGPEDCLPAKEDSNPQRNRKANSQPPQTYGQFCAECGGPINQ
ncbi:hypothetical protein POM88_017272 [Heracleum sosnowskyi]|uniref:Uncharacterized protein n=1 Tax=Heracleum sosnowskyi TaxID=360622 RepID=A0AAD8IN85_9APIA|nr:hypothetical protein POM88_017272 [Heracleum sosnowskyi]